MFVRERERECVCVCVCVYGGLCACCVENVWVFIVLEGKRRCVLIGWICKCVRFRLSNPQQSRRLMQHLHAGLRPLPPLPMKILSS